ncbi:hypothetical protein JOB18_007108 [Solea senegalensis]|uniref:Uncharacterized protein n=1 Tax=Solea senegalensis TaxID=28829 RepID=A0AAV6SX83_SOLSE|nr:hypothetical protein JOB18_007108 [Solea senegalensis]
MATVAKPEIMLRVEHAGRAGQTEQRGNVAFKSHDLSQTVLVDPSHCVIVSVPEAKWCTAGSVFGERADKIEEKPQTIENKPTRRQEEKRVDSCVSAVSE